MALVNIGENLHSLGLSKYFLDKTNTESINSAKFDLIKLKSVCVKTPLRTW